jgi:benzoate-CoA ligase
MGPDTNVARNVSLLLDRNLEAGRGAKVAIRCGDDEYTYADVHGLACAAARRFADLGLRREERVLLVLDDTAAFPAAFLGAIRMGAVPIPVNPLYKADDYRFFLEDSYAGLAVVDDAFWDKVSSVVPEEVRLVPAAEFLTGGDRSELDPAVTHPDDMAFWLYSSGSTGRPKGVVHRQSDVEFSCRTYCDNVLALTDEDVTYSTSKLFHAYGLGNGLTFPYWAGATTVLTPGRPTPDAVFATVDRHRPSRFFCVPTLYNALVNSPGAAERDLSSVRTCVSAAEPLPPEVARRWQEAYGLKILDGIGSTEMLHIYCSNTEDAYRPGSSGTPVPGYDLELRDEFGAPVPQGEVGDLYVRGGSSLAAYWHHRERTARTLVGEWFATGDRYRVDADGFWWYEGRADDMIKVGGLWVSPIEIENVLTEHPDVLEAAVVGVEVEGLTKIRAHIICREGIKGDDTLVAVLVESCKAKLQRYQYPHIVVFTDELPKTITGKIQRFALRAQG